MLSVIALALATMSPVSTVQHESITTEEICKEAFDWPNLQKRVDRPGNTDFDAETDVLAFEGRLERILTREEIKGQTREFVKYSCEIYKQGIFDYSDNLSKTLMVIK